MIYLLSSWAGELNVDIGTLDGSKKTYIYILINSKMIGAFILSSAIRY